LALLLPALGSCAPGRGDPPDAAATARVSQGLPGSIPASTPSPPAASPLPELPVFLAANRPAYLESMRRARAWLDALRVDPLELREKGIKGKKKLVEQLDSYYRLWQVAGDPEKKKLLDRIKQVVAITYEDRYHDMGTISDEWFKQDATSYLRAALVMERLGLDTRRYRKEIQKIHQRLNDQMLRRGPHQQRMFHTYYQHFGLEEPFPLEGALEKGVIATRASPRSLPASQVYELTHEVYALYEYGDRLDVDPFDAEDKRYLRNAFAVLADRYLQVGDPDLLGEIVECMHYLRFSGQPTYRAGVIFLLKSQNSDGSWGNYPSQQKRLGPYVKQGYQLHTTLVAIGALTAVFDMPMPPLPGKHTPSG
jgi:hypothetical protein